MMKKSNLYRVSLLVMLVILGQAAYAKKDTISENKTILSSITPVQTISLSHNDGNSNDFVEVSRMGVIKLEAMQELPITAAVTITSIKYFENETEKTLSDNYILTVTNDNRNQVLLLPEATKIVSYVVVSMDVPNGYKDRLSIVSSLEVERYYSLNNASISVQSSYQSQTNELTFTWGTINNAEEYDLEWTFVYADNGANLNDIKIEPAIFERNSTRVTVQGNSYSIPYVYDKGFILYRVRAVGRTLNEAKEVVPVYGKWSTNLANNCNNLTCVNDNAKFDGRAIAHRENLNWQYTVKYAEEGKNKLSMTYADGSLRSRQSLTKMNSDDNVIVGETIYDHQGRPAVNVLPVPSENNVIDFNSGFNKSVQTAGKAYSRDDFDKDASDCATAASAMDSVTSGAAHYYSSSNPNKDGINAYIPKAEGYPFSLVQYTQDNTGRIQAQGGVGRTMQIKEGPGEHATRYFYGSPTQKELDRLFGSEVGYARYYKKNIVKDPNGQLSVSYLDPADRVIATALAGMSPETLDALPSQASERFYVDLLEKTSPADKVGNNKLDSRGRTLSLSKKILVIAENDKPEFFYANSGAKMQDVIEKAIKYSNGTTKKLTDTKCYDCVLELDMSLTDHCGTEYLNSEAADSIIGKEIVDALRADSAAFFATNRCEQATPSYVVQRMIAQADGGGLAVGEYDLTKVLKVNNEALNAYADDYIRRNNGLIPLDLFEDRAMSEIDFSGCLDCSDCSTFSAYNSYETLPDDYKIQYNKDCIFCFSDSTSFNNFKERCSSDECNDSLCVACDASFIPMLSDMSPNGQYGQVKRSNITTTAREPLDVKMESLPADEPLIPEMFSVSIFNENNQLPDRIEENITLTPSYRNPYNPDFPGAERHYYAPDTDSDNEALTIAYVYVFKMSNGEYEPKVTNVDKLVTVDAAEGIYKIEPQYLKNLKDFLNNWEPEWARSLVIYHPEYQYYKFCKYNNASNRYNDKLQNMDFIKLQNSDLYGLLNSSNEEAFLAQDPFFNPVYDANKIARDLIDNETKRKRLMLSKMKFYSVGNNGQWSSMWQVALMTALAQDTVNCAASQSVSPSTRVSIDDIQGNHNKELFWNTFKQMYISAKQEVVEDMQAHYAIKKQGYCGCIGNENFSEHTNNFFSYTRIVVNPRNFQLWSRFIAVFPWINHNSILRQLYQNLFFNIYSRQSEYHNTLQPCNESRVHDGLFVEKARRFNPVSSMYEAEPIVPNNELCYNTDDISQYGEEVDCDAIDTTAMKEERQYVLQKTMEESTKKAAYLLYEQCHQCPQAKAFEVFLNEMAQRKFLTRTDVIDLNCRVLSFIPSLQDAITDSRGVVQSGNTTWKASPNGRKLKADIKRGSTTYKLDLWIPKAEERLYNFNDILHLCCLNYLESPIDMSTINNGGNFQITATVKVKESDKEYYNAEYPEKTKQIILEGTSKFNIGICKVEPPCEVSQEGQDLVDLFNALLSQPNGSNAVSGQFLSQDVLLSMPPDSASESDLETLGDALVGAVMLDGVISQNLKQRFDAVVQPEVNNNTWYWTARQAGGIIEARIHAAIGTNSNCVFRFAVPAGYTPLAITDITAISNAPDSCMLRMIVQANNATETKRINVPVYSTCFSFSSCPAGATSPGVSTSLANTKNYICELTDEAVKLQDFLKDYNWSSLNLDSLSRTVTLTYNNQQVKLSMPVLGKISLADINPTSFREIARDETTNDNNRFIIYATTQQDVSVLISGEAAFAIGSCYTKPSQSTQTAESAKELETTLNNAINNQALDALLDDDTTACHIYFSDANFPLHTNSILKFSDLSAVQCISNGKVEVLGDTWVSNSNEEDLLRPHLTDKNLYIRCKSDDSDDDRITCIKMSTAPLRGVQDSVWLKLYVSYAVTPDDDGADTYIELLTANAPVDLSKLTYRNIPTGLQSVGIQNVTGKKNKSILFNVTDYIRTSGSDTAVFFIRSYVYPSPGKTQNCHETMIASAETDNAPMLVSGAPAGDKVNFSVLLHAQDGRKVRVYGYSSCLNKTENCNDCQEGRELVKKGNFEQMSSTDVFELLGTTSRLDIEFNRNQYISPAPAAGYIPLTDAVSVKEFWSQTISNLNPNKQYVVSFSAAVPRGMSTSDLFVGLRDAHMPKEAEIKLSENLSVISELKNTTTRDYVYANTAGTFTIQNAHNNGNGWITYKGILTPKQSNMKLVFATSAAKSPPAIIYTPGQNYNSNNDSQTTPRLHTAINPSEPIDVFKNILIDNISIREYDCSPEKSALCEIPYTVSQEVDLRKICLGNLKDVYQYNAQKQYTMYLDSVRNDFIERYIARCLDVSEQLDMNYGYAEHHFTLYYYDQAGNLVRTIPPAGVVPVTAKQDSILIAQDRLNGTHKFYTKHTMATTYAYNSLNQLRYQSMPDQNNMNIWAVERTNSLPNNNYTVNSVSFISPEKGFLTANDGTDNYVYSTNNGGKEWVKVSLSGVKTIRDIVFVNNNTAAYAVGDNGVLMRINTDSEVTEIIPFPSTANLMKIYFSSENTGVIYDKQGNAWTTSNAGTGWIKASNNTLRTVVGGKNIASIDYLNANDAYALTSDGLIYKTTNGGNQWSRQSNIRSMFNLQAISRTQNGHWFIAGDNGTILKREAAGGQMGRWITIPNTVSENINDIFLDDSSNGCVLTTSGKLQTTNDGGTNWNTRLTAISTALSFDASGNGAVANQDTVYITSDAGKSWTKRTVSAANALSDVSAVQKAENIFVADGEGIKRITSAGDVQTVNQALPPAVLSVSKLQMMDYTVQIPSETQPEQFTQTTKTVGVILSNDGNLYALNSENVWDNLGSSYLDMYFSKKDVGYAMKADGTVQKIQFTEGDNRMVTATDLSSKVVSSGLHSLSADTNGNITVTGDNGSIWKTANEGNSWTEESYNILLPEMFALTAESAAATFAVGKKGTIVSLHNSGSYWQVQKSETMEDLHGVSGTQAVGNNGVRLSRNGSVWSVASQQPGITLNDIVQTSAGGWLAAGTEKTVLSSSADENLSGTVSDGALLRAKSSGNVSIVAGENGLLLLNKGYGWSSLNEFKPQQINATQMLNTNVGYAVGNGGAVYKIENGGAQWSPIGTNSELGTQSLRGLYLISQDRIFVAGENGLYVTNNGGANWSKINNVSARLNAIYFLDNKYGYVVGDGGAIYKTTDGGNSWQSRNVTAGNLNAVFVVDENCVYVVGDGVAYRLDAANGSMPMVSLGQLPSNTSFTDVKFIDCMTGYVITESNKLYKTINGGESWEQTPEE